MSHPAPEHRRTFRGIDPKQSGDQKAEPEFLSLLDVGTCMLLYTI